MKRAVAGYNPEKRSANELMKMAAICFADSPEVCSSMCRINVAMVGL